MKRLSSSALRGELSLRNVARVVEWPAEMSYSAVPSVVYSESEAGQHGNFLPASYRRILEQPEWKARLAKAYTGSRFLPRSVDRKRCELECANSSDALLMNIFCYPPRPAPESLLWAARSRPGRIPALRVPAENPLRKWRGRSQRNRSSAG